MHELFSESISSKGTSTKKLSSHLVDFLAIKVRGKGEGGTESIPKGNVSDYFE